MLTNIILSLIILWGFSYLFCLIDEGIDMIIAFIKSKYFVKQKSLTRIYDINSLKNTPLLEFYLNFYRFFLHIKEFPMDFYRETKWFIQRGKRGYSDRDIWNFNFYLTDILINGLNQLNDNKHGYPITITDKKYLDKDGNFNEEGNTINKINWDNILLSMIHTFNTAKEIEENYWYYQESKSYSEKRAEKYQKLQNNLRERKPELYDSNFGRVMTKEECKQYERGWKLFQKHFFNLWD